MKSKVLNAKGLEKSRQVTREVNSLLNSLTKVCSASRELSIVRTKIQELLFFAKKSLLEDKDNLVVEDNI